METVVCHNCGEKSSPTTRFCPGCGLNLGQTPRVSTVEPLLPDQAGHTASAPPSTQGAERDGAPPPAEQPLELMRSGASLGQGRYVLEAPLAPISLSGARSAFLGWGLSAEEQPLVFEDLGASPPSSWLDDMAGSPGDDGNNHARESGARGLSSQRDRLRGLAHPSLATAIDLIVEGDRLVLVRSYVPGRSLQALLDEADGAPLEEGTVLEWAEDVLDVLTYLHGQSPPTVHGDIKPTRLIVGEAGSVSLVGLAPHLVFSRGRRGQGSADDLPWGTVGYAPPEQWAGGAAPAWDLYALGATLHHLLTARDPRSFTRPADRWIYPPPHWLNSQLSERTEALIMRALERDPRKRHPDAATMREDVLAARRLVGRGGRRWPWLRSGV